MNQFKGKNAVVVGGTKGCGFLIAQKLASSGCNVKIIGRVEPKNLTCGINFLQKDLTSLSLKETDEFFDGVLNDADILAVAFGPFLQKKLSETTAKEWNDIVFYNYTLPGILVSKALPRMLKNNFGRILLFGGTKTESIHGYRTNACYAGSKTALGVLVKSCALECLNTNVTCNAILPGFTDNAPKNTKPVSEEFLAEQAMHLMNVKEFNGVLLNCDQGWQA